MNWYPLTFGRDGSVSLPHLVLLTQQRCLARHTLADRSELLDPAQGYTPLRFGYRDQHDKISKQHPGTPSRLP